MIPSDKYFGALPDEIWIKDVQWICIETDTDEEGNTIDSLKNTQTKEVRKVERFKLLKYLEKNPRKDLDTKNKNVSLSYNNQLKL